MRISLVVLMVSLVIPVGCAQPDNDRVAGSYIITMQGFHKDTAKAREVLTAAYGQLGLKSVDAIAKDTFALNIENDPGLEQVKRIGNQVESIQHVQANIRYQLPPQPRPQFQLESPTKQSNSN